MAELKFQEKQIIEKLLGMDTGYVADFSDRTFQLFIGDHFNIDIHSAKYTDSGTSKANKLRTLIAKESDFVVGSILGALLNHQMALDLATKNERTPLYEQVKSIVSKLKGNSVVENLDAIRPVEGDENFTLLAEVIRRSIENSNPREGIDRLHTYLYRYTRQLCRKRGLKDDQSIPLDALFGSYARYLRDTGKVRSETTHKILGSYIQILNKFNNTRNSESLAHDNELIENHEALLILNSIANLLRFVESVENYYEK
jgi:hypothetical protein